MSFIRKNFLVFLSAFISIVLISGAFLYSRHIPLQTATVAEADLSSDLIKSTAQKDSDGDGLYDWEEELWGTDPHKVDSDGNGIPDGEQVKQQAAKIVKDGTQADFALSQNTTGVFSRNFFEKYLEIRSQGDLTDASKTELINAAISSLQLPSQKQAQVSPSLKVDTNTDTLVAYINAINTILTQNSPFQDPNKNELTLLQSLAQNNDPGTRADLVTISAAMENAAKELETIPVPSELFNDHIQLVQSLFGLSSAVYGFSQGYEDPMQTVLSISLYKQSATKLLDYANSANSVFAGNGMLEADYKVGAFNVSPGV